MTEIRDPICVLRIIERLDGKGVRVIPRALPSQLEGKIREKNKVMTRFYVIIHNTGVMDNNILIGDRNIRTFSCLFLERRFESDTIYRATREGCSG